MAIGLKEERIYEIQAFHSARQYKINMNKDEISRESIRDGLEALGISQGDKIVMHSKLGSLGKARDLAKLSNCGADAVTDAFLDLIGSKGILCLPTFTRTFLTSSCGPSGQIFDPDTTPSRVGSITSVFLQREGRMRSLHPTHSWAALGKDVDKFVEGHDRTTTFGRDSICGRMYDWDFKIVWFGTTGTTNTSAHFGEDWLDLPNMVSEDAVVKDGSGWKKVTVYRAPSGPRDFYEDGCKLDKAMEGWRIKREGKVHNSTVTIIRHRDFMQNLLRALIDDPCLLLKDKPDDAYHQRFRMLNLEHMEHLKEKHGGPDNILAWLKI